MLLQTLLNDCYKFSGFKYGKITKKDQIIKVEILAKKNSKGRCPECDRACSKYDNVRSREFWFIPLWGYKIRFIYNKPRRVECKKHGVIVERMPWAAGKSPITTALAIFLAHWAKKLSWQGTAREFQVSWHNVFTAVKYVVDHGLKHRVLSGIQNIGLDEVLFRCGRQFVTLIYETTEDSRRLLWVGLDRKAKTLLRGLYELGLHNFTALKTVSMDMWKPYIAVIKKIFPDVIKILDRFHIMKKFNEAIDDVRRQEVYALQKKGKGEVLTNARWCLLKKPENLTENQEQKLSELTKQNLKSYKVYLLRESFQKFWTYSTAGWAENFLDSWTKTAMRSRIKPIKKVAKMLRRHKDNILNWFRISPRISNAVVEGLNNKVKLVMRTHYGFRTFPAFELALYHSLGALPEPELTHKFF
jgi:transposase